MKTSVDSTQDEIFRTLPISSALQKMIVPAITSQLIVLIYNMADTFFVGQTNNPYMVAGTSLILPVFNITLCLAGLAGIGGGSLISRLLGQSEEQEARRVSAFSLYLGLAIAALFTLGIAIFMEPILNMLGAGENTYHYARQYALCVIVIGGIPTVLSNVLANLIRSVGHSREASTGIILGGILNIVLDPLFMFVLMPDGYEVLGAGLATCLSNCIAFFFFISVLIRMGHNSVITFWPKGGLPRTDNIIAVFGVGIPSAVTSFLFDLDYVFIDKLMVSYDDLALAAIGIVLKIERFPLNVGVGICQGMLPLVAYNYSAGNKKRMDDTIRLARRLGLATAAISIVLYEIFAVQFAHLFIEDAQTVSLASQFLRIRVLATPLMFLSFFTVYVFQAFGKGRISLFLGTTRWLVFNIPMLFILNFFFGMYGIVWSQVTADILTVLLSFYILQKYRPSEQDMPQGI
ncbi:MATE family efflux transporter [uncultured Ruthenibacterium sp.]|uniref:MATE family efflux transporter n=1 Tax=uncultured Ruthenibacterium sp. TaxID=1905347 RepID=UPI00349E7D5B